MFKQNYHATFRKKNLHANDLFNKLTPSHFFQTLKKIQLTSLKLLLCLCCNHWPRQPTMKPRPIKNIHNFCIAKINPQIILCSVSANYLETWNYLKKKLLTKYFAEKLVKFLHVRGSVTNRRSGSLWSLTATSPEVAASQFTLATHFLVPS